MTTTICGLCRLSRPIVDSHLIPASLYKLLRDEEAKNPNPVVVSGVKARTSSQQVQKPFLCVDCEDLLSKNGETDIAPNCARTDSFPLREKLNVMHPLVVHDKFAAYDLHEAFGNRARNFLYFAVSVFWRASATIWPRAREFTRLISLGPHEEPVRKYLLGEGDLPPEVVIMMSVANDSVPRIITFPARINVEGRCWFHQFVIPGIVYSALVGRVPEAQRDVRMNRGAATVVFYGPLKDANIFKNILSFGKTIELSSALKERYRGSKP